MPRSSMRLKSTWTSRCRARGHHVDAAPDQLVVGQQGANAGDALEELQQALGRHQVVQCPNDLREVLGAGDLDLAALVHRAELAAELAGVVEARQGARERPREVCLEEVVHAHEGIRLRGGVRPAEGVFVDWGPFAERFAGRVIVLQLHHRSACGSRGMPS